MRALNVDTVGRTLEERTFLVLFDWEMGSLELDREREIERN